MLRSLIYGFFLVFASAVYSQTKMSPIEMEEMRVHNNSFSARMAREEESESQERELSILRLNQMRDEAQARKIQLRAKEEAYNDMVMERNDGVAFLNELNKINPHTPDYPIKEAELFLKYPLALRCRIGIEFVLEHKRRAYRTFAQQEQLPVPEESSLVQLLDAEDSQRVRNALLSDPLTGSSSTDQSIEELQKQTKLLKEQKNALESQLLIMQQNANKR